VSTLDRAGPAPGPVPGHYASLVSLTCTGEARKTHDLLDLSDNFPGNSRDRLEADFSTMRDVLTEHRGTFGTWRYFETDATTDAFKGITRPKPTQVLGKGSPRDP